MAAQILFIENAPLEDAAINALFASAWPDHTDRDFQPVLARSLGYVCAYAGSALVGFVNLAWDGGVHAFLLDTAVHANWQHRGIGRQLVLHAVDMARRRGIEWLHVDYEPRLEAFYRGCGFEPTLAGLIRLH